MSRERAGGTPTRSSGEQGARDAALDMTKGLMVIGMLLTHANNMFADFAAYELIYPGLIGFISGAWLFVAGYIVGLRSGTSFRRAPGLVTRRLLSRGVRLVGVFVVSNLLLGHLSPAACGVAGDRCDLLEIFVLGDDRQAFEVLLGIGYVLIFAPIFLRLPRASTALIVVVLVIGLSVLEAAGLVIPLLAWMLACGFAGIALGLYYSPAEVRAAGSPSAGVMVAMLVWVVTKALNVTGMVSSISPVVYVPHVVSSLWLLYVAGEHLKTVTIARRPLALMAQYSLLAYMGQMLLLQVWRILTADVPGLRTLPVSMVAVLAALLLSLATLSALRRRSRVVDSMYRAVFG